MFHMVSSGNLYEIENVSTEVADKLVDGIDLHDTKAPCTRTNSLPINRMPPSQVRRHWRAKRAASSALSSLHEVSRRNEAWIKKTDDLFRSLRLQRSSSGESQIPSIPHTRRSSRQMSHHSSSSEEWYEEFLKPNETGESNRIPIVQTRISEVSERQSNDDELIQQTSSVINSTPGDPHSRKRDDSSSKARLSWFSEEPSSHTSDPPEPQGSRKKKHDKRTKRKCLLCSIQ